MNSNYYATVGSSLWKRPTAGGQWQRVVVPGFMANGVGYYNSKLYVGTDNGVYESSDGTNFTKVAGYNNSAAVYQIVSNTIFFVVQDSVLGQLAVYDSGTFTGPKYKVTGLFTGSNGSNAVSGSNGIFNDTSGKTKCLFSYISGLNRQYLYADGKVGEYECPSSSSSSGKWTKSVDTGYAASRGSAIFQLTTTKYNSVKALFAVYGLGYFELYEESGNLKVRSPKITVKDADAYAVSDLGTATITSFYENNGDIFALTSRKGLWRLTDGVWYQE